MSTEWPSDLLFDSEDNDVELRIEAALSDKQLSFPAHSFILKRTSDVFRAMLMDGNFKEGLTKIVELKVQGNEIHAMALYTYLYKKNLSGVDMQGYLALLQAGHLYHISSLVETCEEKMMSLLAPCSVCGIALLVKPISEELYKKCINLMLRSAFYIFDNNLYLFLSEDIMQQLLESDYLNVFDEDQAVDAVWIWYKARALSPLEKMESPQREVSLFKFIRWNSVKNYNETAPWFEAAEEIKAAFIEGEEESRKLQVHLSLFPFSHKFSLNRAVQDLAATQGTFKDLMVFCVKQKILISGFVLKVATGTVLAKTEDIPLKITMNGQVMTRLTTPSRLRFCGMYQNQYWYQIDFECCTPVLIDNSCINYLKIKSADNVKALAYFRSPESSVFSFHGVVLGVRNIFYFLKD